MNTTGLRKFQRKNCYDFVERLARLKGRIDDKDELRSSLTELHKAFCKMKLSLEIELYSEKSLIKPAIKETASDIVKYEAGPFTFLAVGDRVVGLEDLYQQELEPCVVNASVEDIPILARMYMDFKTRKCDFCGKYFYADTFEAPLGRMVEVDYIGAFHNPCKLSHALQ